MTAPGAIDPTAVLGAYHGCHGDDRAIGGLRDDFVQMATALGAEARADRLANRRQLPVVREQERPLVDAVGRTQATGRQ